MSDTPTQTPEGQDPQASTAPVVRVLNQYLKDLSFESPASPDSLRADLTPPGIEVAVDVNARRLGGDQYEVELACTATARRDDTTVFLVEANYAGLFFLQNVPDQQLEPFLLVEAPRLLFPFARQIIANATRDGGFPPMLLEPIDFGAMFQMQRARAAQDAAGGNGEPVGNA